MVTHLCTAQTQRRTREYSDVAWRPNHPCASAQAHSYTGVALLLCRSCPVLQNPYYWASQRQLL